MAATTTTAAATSTTTSGVGPNFHEGGGAHGPTWTFTGVGTSGHASAGGALHGNVLEDALDRVFVLPIETKRVCALMRELDAKCAVDLERLAKLQDEHVLAVRAQTALKNVGKEEDAATAAKRVRIEANVRATKLRLDQKLEERVSLATQLHDLYDRHVKRLTHDASMLEDSLRKSGELDDRVNDMPTAAAAAIAPMMYAQTSMGMGMGGGGGGGAPTPGGAATSSSAFPLPGQTHLASALTSSLGGTPAPVLAPGDAIPPNTIVAACTRQDSGSGEGEEDLWILGRVTEPVGRDQYVVVDIEDATKRFTMKRKRIVPLSNDDFEDVTAARARLGARNKLVHALYPDTTSFYPAVLTSLPSRATPELAREDPALVGKTCCVVQFQDDEDPTTGVVPKRVVPCKFVFSLA